MKVVSTDQNLEDEASYYAALNATKHGKAMVSPVVSSLFASHPELRSNPSKAAEVAVKAVTAVNNMEPSAIAALMRSLEARYSKKEEKVQEARTLPPLPDAFAGHVVTRFAPNPDAPIHLGNARALVLSAEYAKMYRGKFILRFEDTDPHVKPPLPEAYDWIRQDVEWLGYRPDTEWVQSQHLDNYYDAIRHLIEVGSAYVCTCSAEDFRKKRVAGVACPHREQPVERSLTLFEDMVSGKLSEGQAVVRLKTSMSLPNPALRDFPLARIVDPVRHPHPMLKEKRWVFPLYNLSASVDDHLLGVTHVLRGKEHLANEVAQGYIYAAMGWKQPISVEHGRLRLEGIPLSKSEIKKGLQGGDYVGWDDPRLGTLMALRRRGFSSRSIVDLILEVGPKPTDAVISWENLYAINRKYLEPVSHRYFVVREPVCLQVDGLENRQVQLPLHPDHPEMGFREIIVRGSVCVEKEDLPQKGGLLRLMELATIEYAGDGHAVLREMGAEEAVRLGIKRVQWVPSDPVKIKVVTAESSLSCAGEPGILTEPVGATVQMVRWGFARVDSREPEFTLYFAHR